jgi:MFS family permease
LAAVSGLNFANNATAIGILTVFIVPLTEDFGWTRTQISAVTSVGAVLGALVAPFTGQLTDRLGARIPLSLGGAIIVLAMLNLASMQSLAWFAIAFSLARLADQAFIQVPSPPAIGKWFRRYRGRAMAVLACSTSAGGVILPLLVQLIIDTWHWRLAWVVLGGLMAVLGVIPCIFLVRRQPEDLGLLVDGAGTPRQAAVDSSSPGDGPHGAARQTEVSWRLREAATTPTLWLLLISMLIVGAAWTGVGLHLVPYLRQRGLAPTAAVGAVSVWFLASGVSTLLWGFSADKLSAWSLLVVAHALRAASVAVLLVSDTMPKAYIFAILQGCADGGLSTLPTVLLSEYYGRQHLGAIYGGVRAMLVMGFALGPLIAGAAFDSTRSYHDAFLAFLVLSILGTGLVGLAKRPRTVRTALR